MAVLTEEQNMLKDAARTWVRERSPISALRALRKDDQSLGYDPALCREMAEMGWMGVVAPEQYGGSDFGYLSLGVVLEELGRNLTASPIVSSALAGVSALTLAGSEAQKAKWLPAIISGDIVATIALDEGPHHAPLMTALAAEPDGDGWTLNGDKRPVLEGMAADLVIVAARTAGAPGDEAGISLFLIEAYAAGLSRTRLPQVDSRGAATLGFENVRVERAALLGAEDGGAALLDQILDRARAGLAAEMLGTAMQAFETTLDYLKTRVQFGQLIGSFQALQHRAADMYGELEMTRSVVEAALSAIDAGAPDTAELVSLAKIMACDTLRLVANEMVQMHGGIGMTDEHDAGLYLKRARTAAAAYGGASFHRERFGRLTRY